jgi:hypothetical protein
LEALVPDLLNEPTAEAYAAIRADDLKEKYYSAALNRYVRAVAACGYVGDAIEAIDEQPAAFSRRYARFKRAVEQVLYANRRTRINLKPEHKADIIFYTQTKKAIKDTATNDKIKLSEVRRLINDRTRATAKDGTKIKTVKTTTAEIERIIQKLFEVDIDYMPSGERVYTISDLPPLPPIKNPTRFISLFG